MLRHVFLALACLAALAATEARAHFIWLDLQSAAGGMSQARLYFSEEPEPGEPALVGKASKMKVWLRKADGALEEVQLNPASETEAALVASCNATAASLEGNWDYGVYSHGPKGMLLQYYAKGLGTDWAEHPELARAEKLKLDIVPTLKGKKLAVQVLYDGKPVAGGDVQFVDPAGEHHDLTTDEQGRVEITSSGGQWAVRANVIEADKGGERDGKKFQQTWHYATATLDMPGAQLAAKKKIEADPEAVAALERAREGRAIWSDFPGFTADLKIYSGSAAIKAKVEIDADGVVTLDMPQSDLSDWVEEQLNSMVQHRMPDGEVSQGDVTFADEPGDHPLGRKIDLGDPSLESAYRLKDDVIMEVNRTAGPTLRFTISVLEIERNSENKYLPRSFTMNFFDSKSGELRTSLGYLNSWQRVGTFDLPTEIIEVDAHKGGANTKAMAFSNYQLLPKK